MIVAWRILGYKQLDMAERLSLFLLKGFRICHVKICHFGIEVTLSQRQLRGNRCRREFLCTTPICWRRHWHPTPVLLPGKSHGWRSLVGCSPWGRKESCHFPSSLSCIGEGNGNPLQCSCLENPRDGGAWWAAVCGVTQSRTRLKRLSSSSTPICLKARQRFLSMKVPSQYQKRKDKLSSETRS